MITKIHYFNTRICKAVMRIVKGKVIPGLNPNVDPYLLQHVILYNIKVCLRLQYNY
jgi:hypothetical protein